MTIFPSLYYITGDDPEFSHVAQVERACAAGIKMIQVRMKGASYTELLHTVISACEICRAHGTLLIVNDNVAVAKEAQADGVHLGKHDMAPERAREILGADAIIGATANTVGDVTQLLATSISYIGLGPYRFTATKKNLSPVLGRSGVEHISRVIGNSAREMPLVAVGGIKLEEIDELLSFGVQSVAISSDLRRRLKSSQSVSYESTT